MAVPALPPDAAADDGAEIGPRREVAQPVFADYWMHNKGAAPMGYQALAVQIRPGRASRCSRHWRGPRLIGCA